MSQIQTSIVMAMAWSYAKLASEMYDIQDISATTNYYLL